MSVARPGVAETESITRSSSEWAAGHLRYRADINGLRAIAIGPVVLYHAGFSALTGGFVGVDVFFVISGYLMASLILSDMERGTFSLVQFYERRIRRIFPALFVTIAASAAAAWALLMPTDLEYFARSVMAAALFGSNILFWDESGYFDTAAQLKPLLHTWSLAVEEQFYILFPLLLVLLGKLGRRWIILALTALLLASLAFSVWQVAYSPLAAFYLSPSRCWELLLGSMLALGVIPRFRSPIINELLALLGIVLIGMAIFTYSEDTPFPGVAALAPCLGAALVIYARVEDGLLGKVLGAPPVVFLGLVSYSLYLWHWPLIVFARSSIGGTLSTAQSVAVVAASLILAALSWCFVEEPFRGRASPINRQVLFTGAAAAVASSIAFGAFVDRGNGWPGRLPPEVQAIYRASYDKGRFSTSDCFIDSTARSGPSLADIGEGTLCGMGAADAPDVIFLVWGDSHAASMGPAIDVAAQEAGYHGLMVGAGSCAPLLNFDFGQTNREKVARCKEVNAAVVDLIAKKRIATIFMIARWPKYVHGAEYGNEGVFFDPARPIPLDDKSGPVREGLDRTLSALSKLGAHVVLVMDVPEMGYDVPYALAKAAMNGTSRDIAPSPEAVRKRQALARRVLDQYAAKYNATIIDPTPVICDQTQCHPERDGVILYRNEDHLSGAGAESLSSLFKPFFEALR